MNIYIHKNNVQTGPFNVQQINEQLMAGVLNGSDMAYYDGANQWAALSSVPGIVLKSIAHPPGSASNRSGLDNIQQYARSSMTWIPLIAKNPLVNVPKLCSQKNEIELLWIASLVYLLSTAAIVLVVWFKFSEAHLFSNITIPVFSKALISVVAPFVALGIANGLLYKFVLANLNIGFGRSFVEAASAFLPLQLAVLISLILGFGNLELIIGVSAFSVIISNLITYELSSRSAGEKSNAVLMLTPLKIFLAAYITKVIWMELIFKGMGDSMQLLKNLF
jgi:hypothetical protein